MTTYVISTKDGRSVKVVASSPEDAKIRARQMLSADPCAVPGPDSPPLPTLDPGSRAKTLVGGRPGGVLVPRGAPHRPSPHERFRALGQRLAGKGGEFGAKRFVRFCEQASDLSLANEVARDRIVDLERQLASADRRVTELENYLLDAAPAERIIEELAHRIDELEELLAQEKARSEMAKTSLMDSFEEDTKTSSSPLPEGARRTSAVTVQAGGGS